MYIILNIVLYFALYPVLSDYTLIIYFFVNILIIAPLYMYMKGPLLKQYNLLNCLHKVYYI